MNMTLRKNIGGWIRREVVEITVDDSVLMGVPPSIANNHLVIANLLLIQAQEAMGALELLRNSGNDRKSKKIVTRMTLLKDQRKSLLGA
jgi:hypothetical protein